MATWVWFVIAIGALLVLGLVGFGMMRGREKAQRREKAQELRQEAQARLEQAEEQLGVSQIHLAAVGFNVDFAGVHQVFVALACSVR